MSNFQVSGICHKPMYLVLILLIYNWHDFEKLTSSRVTTLIFLNLFLPWVILSFVIPFHFILLSWFIRDTLHIGSCRNKTSLLLMYQVYVYPWSQPQNFWIALRVPATGHNFLVLNKSAAELSQAQFSFILINWDLGIGQNWKKIENLVKIQELAKNSKIKNG